MPEQAKQLTQEQVTYLERLGQNLSGISAWNAEELQTTLFATAKELEMQQPIAFKAVYFSFLGKERGPKAGALLSYLERKFVIDRLQEVVKANAVLS
jgi:lysyl-tRNA synthetase class 1